MLILLGVFILIVSFVIALVSMMRENRKVSENKERLQSWAKVEKPIEAENAKEEPKSPPDANQLDVLKSRIDELAAQEAAESGNLSKEAKLTGDERGDEAIDKKAFERAKLDEFLGGQSKAQDSLQNNEQDEELDNLFGLAKKPSASSTDGTISVQDLAREKGKSEDNSS